MSASGDSANPVDAIGSWVAALQLADVPEYVRQDARLRLLDSLGLILVGRTTEAGAAVARTALAGPPGTATQALAWGTLAHCRDFDDTFADSVVHPGSVVVPTALAVAQSEGSSDDELEMAIVIGYEIAARVGHAFGRGLGTRGFHATGIVGPIAAAATAGRLMRLDAAQIGSAIGLACSMSSGLMAFVVDGAWSKWMHAGWSAQGGVTAAQLARQGFIGPRAVFSNDRGIVNAFLGSLPSETLDLDDLGTRWSGTSADYKYYPCAHVIQPFIDAVLTLMRERQLAASEVESIICGIAPWAAAVVAEPREAKLRFDTELEAIASLPFQVAIAVLDGDVTLASLSARNRARDDVAALAARVTHRRDASLQLGFDGTLALTTRDGRTFEALATAAPHDTAHIVSKFRTNARMLFDTAPRLANPSLAEDLASRCPVEAFPVQGALSLAGAVLG